MKFRSRIKDMVSGYPALHGAAEAALEAGNAAEAAIANRPALYRLYARLRPERGLRVGEDTGIVIEGFPNSANTFAVVAFTHAQASPVKVAHHMHTPSQVIAAAKFRIPAVLLIRDPEGAVLSFVAKDPKSRVEHALRRYMRFYHAVYPHRGRFLTALFTDVTTDFGSVIRRLNIRFGTSFGEFEHTEENVRKVFSDIEALGRRLYGSGVDAERMTARPSELKREAKERLREEFHSGRLAGLRDDALCAYEMFVSLACP